MGFADDFAGVPGDAFGRVEGADGVLEDHADGVAAKRLQGGLGGVKEVGAGELHGFGGDCGAAGFQAEQGEAQHGLAGAGLADDAEDLGGAEVQVDAAEDVQAAAGRVEGQIEGSDV